MEAIILLSSINSRILASGDSFHDTIIIKLQYCIHLGLIKINNWVGNLYRGASNLVHSQKTFLR